MKLRKWVKEFQSKCYNKGYYPCWGGLRYLNKHKNLQEAWNKCSRSDWMWWLLGFSTLGTRSHLVAKPSRHVTNSDGHNVIIPEQYTALGHLMFIDSSINRERTICNLIRDLTKCPRLPE